MLDELFFVVSLFLMPFVLYQGSLGILHTARFVFQKTHFIFLMFIFLSANSFAQPESKFKISKETHYQLSGTNSEMPATLMFTTKGQDLAQIAQDSLGDWKLWSWIQVYQKVEPKVTYDTLNRPFAWIEPGQLLVLPFNGNASNGSTKESFHFPKGFTSSDFYLMLIALSFLFFLIGLLFGWLFFSSSRRDRQEIQYLRDSLRSGNNGTGVVINQHQHFNGFVPVASTTRRSVPSRTPAKKTPAKSDNNK